MSEFTNPDVGTDVNLPDGGFCFDNIHRNNLIQKMANSSDGNSILPHATKTGTTIVGLIYKNGVVLGADTRATNGEEVAEKNCQKIHYIAPNIRCCGAGTAADTDKTTELISSQMELLRMNSGGSQSRVVTACTLLKRMLFRYQGYISAALILGGCDVNGPHLYHVYPHGYTAKQAFTTMGSGSLASIAVFEAEYRDDMEEDEAVELVKRAILAGIFNDLGSGSNCDTCVIRMDGTTTVTRGAVKPNDSKPLRDRIVRSDKLNMRPGTTPVLKSTFTPSKNRGVTLADVTVTPMET